MFLVNSVYVIMLSTGCSHSEPKNVEFPLQRDATGAS